jgi:hypothetical protein
MIDTLIAFVGMAVVVSIFLLFVVWWGRRTERAKSATPEGENTPVQATPPAPTITDCIMSCLLGAAGPAESIETEQRSYAAEPRREPPGTAPSEPVPDLVEQLAALTDDELLDILALLPDEDDGWRFAESESPGSFLAGARRSSPRSARRAILRSLPRLDVSYGCVTGAAND